MTSINATPTVTRRTQYRGRIGVHLLLAALALGPVAWMAQLLVVYAVASHGCYPDGAPLLDVTRVGFWWFVLIVNVIGIGLAAMAGFTSLRNYRVARIGEGSDRPELATRVEGRSRFLAGWGGMAGLLFFVGAIFDLIAIVTVPPCLG